MKRLRRKYIIFLGRHESRKKSAGNSGDEKLSTN